MAIALIFAGSAAISLFFVKLKIELNRTTHPLDSGVALALSHLLAGTAIASIWLPHSLASDPTQMIGNQRFWFAAAIMAIMGAWGKWLNYRAIKQLPIGFVSAMSAITPLVTILAGIWLLDEVPSGIELAGIVLVAGSILCFFLFTLEEQMSWREILRQPGVVLAIVSALPPAIAVVTQRMAVLALDPVSLSLVYLLGVGLITLVSSSAQPNVRTIASVELRRSRIYQLAVLLLIAQLCYATAAQMELAAKFGALSRVSILFQYVFSYWFFRDRNRIGLKIFFSSTILIGFALIAS